MRTLLTAAALVVAAGASFGQVPAPKNPVDLSLEVTALQSLHNFNLNAHQLEQLSRSLKNDPIVDRKRLDGKISPKLFQALADVRLAYAKPDEKSIASALQAFDKLYEIEDADLDDAIVITPAARKRTAEFVRQLSPGQVANYFAYYSLQWKGPADRLFDTLMAGILKTGEEWFALRDASADSIAWLMAGCDDEAFKDAYQRIIGFLDRAHKLKGDELMKQRPELEESVRKLTIKLGPIEVLKHALERDVAALLSNPRLANAVDWRRSALKK